jgi:hypothetical protein
MTEFETVRFSPHTGDHLLNGKVVECYRNVFADEPWNEWLKCAICGKYWGKKDMAELVSFKFEHCGLPVSDYWPREQVLGDLFHEITEDSSAWLTVLGDMVIGFCWGYPISLAELESPHKLNIMFSDKLSRDSKLCVAYQDEVGVELPYRGRKLAKKMVALRHDDFLNRGLTVGVVRTRQFPKPSDTFSWYTKTLGYDIIARYPGDDGRVILARDFVGLRDLLVV